MVSAIAPRRSVYGMNSLVGLMKRCKINNMHEKYVKNVQYGRGIRHCQKSYGRFRGPAGIWNGIFDVTGRFVNATCRHSKCTSIMSKAWTSRDVLK